MNFNDKVTIQKKNIYIYIYINTFEVHTTLGYRVQRQSPRQGLACYPLGV